MYALKKLLLATLPPYKTLQTAMPSGGHNE
jgi:hypothetical protein